MTVQATIFDKTPEIGVIKKSGKLPDTSLSAYREAKRGLIATHHEKILQALEVLGKANYEAIGGYLNIDPISIARRLSELERMDKVYKPGTKVMTKNNRLSYEYARTNNTGN